GGEVVDPRKSATSAQFAVYPHSSITASLSQSYAVPVSNEPVGDALWIPPLVYLVFCLINFQAGPDLISLFPFIGFFAGLAVIQIASLFKNARIACWLPKLIASMMLLLAVWRGINFWRASGPQLEGQIQALGEIKKQLSAGEKIFVHGATE